MRISLLSRNTIAVASSAAKGRGETRYHGADAGVAGKEAVIAILTFARVAEVARPSSGKRYRDGENTSSAPNAGRDCHPRWRRYEFAVKQFQRPHRANRETFFEYQGRLRVALPSRASQIVQKSLCYA